MPQDLTIGELARRSGVTTTTLRYYDELGLVKPARRLSGQRRYDDTAVATVGVVKFLQEVGLTLAETNDLMRTRSQAPTAWRDLAIRKVDELRGRIAKERAAVKALEHSLGCPMEDPAQCPTFWKTVRGVVGGAGLADAHTAAHAD